LDGKQTLGRLPKRATNGKTRPGRQKRITSLPTRPLIPTSLPPHFIHSTPLHSTSSPLLNPVYGFLNADITLKDIPITNKDRHLKVETLLIVTIHCSSCSSSIRKVYTYCLEHLSYFIGITYFFQLTTSTSSRRSQSPTRIPSR
jgi:hypothetical protein